MIGVVDPLFVAKTCNAGGHCLFFSSSSSSFCFVFVSYLFLFQAWRAGHFNSSIPILLTCTFIQDCAD